MAVDPIWTETQQLAVGTGVGTATVLDAGTEGQILGVSGGLLAWLAAPSGSVATDAIFNASGDLAVGTGADTAARLGRGSEGQVLTVQGTTLAWLTAPTVSMATDLFWGAKADLAVGTADNTAARLPVGSNDQYLVAASGTATGLKWASHPYIDVTLKGAVGDGVTNDAAAFAAAVTALPAGGGTILLGAANYKQNSTWTLSKKIRVIGAGPGEEGSAGTTLTFAAGVTGISVEDSTCHLEGFRCTSQSTIAGTDNGIQFRGGTNSTVIDVHVERFGQDGFNFDSNGVNNNHILTMNTMSRINLRHGYFRAVDVSGNDHHRMTSIGDNARGNAGWGFYDDGHVNCYINPHVANNTLGGYILKGTGTVIDRPYSESSQSLRLEGAIGCFIVCPGSFAAPNVIYSSGGDAQKNLVILNDSFFDGVSGVKLTDHALTGDRTRRWALRSYSDARAGFDRYDTGTKIWSVFHADNHMRVHTPLRVETNVGFFNTAPITKPTLTGDFKGIIGAKNLATLFAGYGLLTDSSTLGTAHLVSNDPIFTGKGYLPVGTAASTAAGLAPGSNGQFLQAQSGETTGLKWVDKPYVTLRKSSNEPRSLTALEDVTGLTTPVLSGVTYVFDFEGTWESAATSTGLKLSVNGPAATNFQAEIEIYKNTGTAPGTSTGTQPIWVGVITTLDAAIINDSAQATGVPMKWRVHGVITPSANGTLALRFGSEVGGSAVTIHANSRGIVWS